MIKELVKKSRSCRGYDESRKISREELLELVDCARFAPSSVNRQPFQYLLYIHRLLPFRSSFFLKPSGPPGPDEVSRCK